MLTVNISDSKVENFFGNSETYINEILKFIAVNGIDIKKEFIKKK